MTRALAVLTAAVLGVASACSPSEPAVDPSERESAPGFELGSLDGSVVRLADLRGKTVIVDFWATWCPPCEFQVPELNAFWEAHAASGELAVIGISVDSEGPEVVGEWVAEKGVRYPILLGDENLARQYGALGFPTLVIIDREGRIESRHVGLIERAELEEAFQKLREAPPGARAG